MMFLAVVLQGTVADPGIIFSAALKANADSHHYKPQSSFEAKLKPGRQDEELTQKIKKGGQFLEIKFLDHIIVTTEGYYLSGDGGLVKPFFCAYLVPKQNKKLEFLLNNGRML